jgi:hypothetical protein
MKPKLKQLAGKTTTLAVGQWLLAQTDCAADFTVAEASLCGAK